MVHFTVSLITSYGFENTIQQWETFMNCFFEMIFFYKSKSHSQVVEIQKNL